MACYLGQHYADFETATGYGTGAGLCGWNCRHTFFVVFPELGSPPAWTQESLEQLNARDIEYDGRLYTRYEISQMQRARERAVRKWKRRYLAETESGVDATNAAVRLRAARAELADFIARTGGKADSARTSVHGFGRSEAGKATALARKAAKPNRSSGLLQKLNFADSVPQTERESIEKELSVLPQWQRSKAESIIDKVVLVGNEESGSGYYYPTRTLYLHPERSDGDVIHEYGHAFEIASDLIHNKEYIRIRRAGINIADFSKVVYDEDTFKEGIWRMENDKFVSLYQGRMYEHVEFYDDDGNINLNSMLEYFSEGYRAFYKEPALLKAHDPQLYDFIEGLKDDKG